LLLAYLHRTPVYSEQEKIKQVNKELLYLYKTLLEKQWDIRYQRSQIEAVTVEDLSVYISSIHYLLASDDCYSDPLKILRHKNPYVEPLLKLPPVYADLRVYITWDKATADVELQVINPSNEMCCALHNQAKDGGIMSIETYGFGPTEYILKRGVVGKYTIKVNLFSTLHSIGNRGDVVTVFIRVFTHFGDPSREQVRLKLVNLSTPSQPITVGTVTFYS